MRADLALNDSLLEDVERPAPKIDPAADGAALRHSPARFVNRSRGCATFGACRQPLTALARDLEMDLPLHEHDAIVPARRRARVVDSPGSDA